MKFKALLFVLAVQLYICTSLQLAFAEQKLVNITEDTLAQDSYRPVAGKEFLVAVKLVDVDTETNTEQPVSNETIMFQTSVGTISWSEVVTNIYGEATAWLTTSDIAGTTHIISVQVKDKLEIAPITIEVQNIALPQGSPTAEELIQQVEDNTNKIKDIMADIQVTSNAPWESPSRQLKIWQKDEKYKIQEILPNPKTTVRPELTITNPPEFIKEIVAYNQGNNIYIVKYRQKEQTERLPLSLDYIDPNKGVIIAKAYYLKEDTLVTKMLTEDSDFVFANNIWIFQKEEQKMYQGLRELLYTTTYDYTNIQVNTGLLDSEFQQ